MAAAAAASSKMWCFFVSLGPSFSTKAASIAAVVDKVCRANINSVSKSRRLIGLGGMTVLLPSATPLVRVGTALDTVVRCSGLESRGGVVKEDNKKVVATAEPRQMAESVTFCERGDMVDMVACAYSCVSPRKESMVAFTTWITLEATGMVDSYKKRKAKIAKRECQLFFQSRVVFIHQIHFSNTQSCSP